jgi:RHS repeat-associated protein
MPSFSQSTGLRLAFLCCFAGAVLYAQSEPWPEPTTPTASGIAPGSPAGSYALSGFDTVNLFDGHVNVQIPVLTIGGRGEAGYTMTLPVPASFYSVAYNPGPVNYGWFLTPTWTPNGPLTPGYLELRANVSVGSCGSGPGEGQNTDMILVFSDQNGTEHTLIDTVNYGAPYQGVGCSGGPTPNRGSQFIATDGSNIVFTSNGAVADVSTVIGGSAYFAGAQNGQLYFPDGRAYEVQGGFITAIRDRNGNLVTLNYEYASTLGTVGDTNTHLLLSVTDSLGRMANINWPANDTGCTTISYRNMGYKFCQATLDAALVRPDLLDGGSLSNAQTALLNLEGTGVAPLQWAPGGFEPIVVSSLSLPNLQSYSFLYGPLGDIAQVTLPTGGAFQYDISCTTGVMNGSDSTYMLGTYPNYTTYRRLTARRMYQNATDTTTLQQTIKYSVQTTETAGATTSPSGIITSPTGTMVATVTYTDANGATWKSEQHTFNSAPELQIGSNYTQGLGFPTWSDGLETQVQEFSPGSTTPIRSVATTWAQQSPQPSAFSNASYFGFPPEYNPRVTQTYTTVDSVTSAQVFCYDSTPYNNVTDVWEYTFGVVVGSIPAGCPSTGSGYVRHKHTTYDTSTAYTANAVNLVSLPTIQQVMDTGDNVIAETDYYYDVGTIGPAASITQHTSTVSTAFPLFGTSYTPRGNVTSVVQWLETAAGSVTTLATYDIAGNVLTVTDPNSNKTTFVYTPDAWGSTGTLWGGSGPSSGSTYAFPTSIINALAQTSTFTYGYNAGKLATASDANLPAAKTTYDYSEPGLLQRLTSVIYPIGSTDTYVYDDIPGNIYVSKTSSMTTTLPNTPCDASGVQSEIEYDGLGRQTTSEVLGPNGWIVTTQAYDALNRVSQVSNPSESGTSPSTRTLYDVLNRVVKVTTPDGAVTQTQYSGYVSGSTSYDQALITDPANNQRTLYYDALGRLEEVFAQTSGTTYSASDYTTNYAYDVLNDLLSVTSADTGQSSRTRRFYYDGLGRLTKAINPENGTTQFTYDNNSNLFTKTANDNIKTSYTYDALNRLTLKSYNDSVTPTVNYAYDTNEAGSATPNYYIGHLSQVSTAALGTVPATSTTYLQYDANGRVVANQQKTGTQGPFNFTYSYNDLSLDTETYPSQRSMESCYDSAGRVSQILNLTVATHPAYAGLTYTLPSGTVTTTITMGNQLVETDTTNTRLQTTGIQVGTQPNSGSVMSLGFSYGTTNNNGNLLSQTITRGSQTWVQSYVYDGLNRISCANENPSTPVACAASTGNWARTYGYDPWANGWVSNNTGLITNSFTPTASTNFDGANHLLTGGASYSDPSNILTGNQTVIGGYTLTYDAENRVSSSAIQSNTTTYVYDGNGHRVMKSTGTAATTYVYDAMNQLIAEYGTPSAVDTGTKYVSVDHLGSTRLVTDTSSPTPNQEICYDFLPFGELIPSGTDGRSGCYGSTATPLTQKFTGQERDVETNNDFFQARYMSAPQGRFTSADPLGNFVASAADPQSWNMYSYARNNPLAFIDPSGYDYCETPNGETSPSDDFGGVDSEVCGDLGGTWQSSWDITDNVNQYNAQQITLNPDPDGWLDQWSAENGPMDSGFTFFATGTSIAPSQEPGRGTPSNAPPSYQSACVTDALKIGGVTIGVDLLGVIPGAKGAGTVARGIGHWANYRGIVADNFGLKVIEQAGTVSNTVTLTGGLRDADWVSIVLGVAGFVPVLGQAAAGASIVWDGVKTWKAIQACP